MFDGLSNRLQEIFGKLRRQGPINEKDFDAALREIRQALLEADVNFAVARTFMARIKEIAVGKEVLKGLNPTDQIIKIVHDGIVDLLGQTATPLTFASQPPTVILLVGLQGSGKTTTAAKLARFIQKQGHRPVLIAADVYRPAAIDQLKVLGQKLDIPVFEKGTKSDPVDVVSEGIARCSALGGDVAICDTAGRLHIDEEMMKEAERIKERIAPHAIVLVMDAMAGQDALQSAFEFDKRVGLTGLILTKLDGDARGGAALSARAVTGKPILFLGMGERLEQLEPFYPDRLASRILGMGDVVSLVEKAQASITEDQAKAAAKKLTSANFTFSDFKDQLQMIKKMGPISQIMGMIPGMSQLQKAAPAMDENALVKVEAIINSMTADERRTPDIIDGSRRARIARGSGRPIQEVNQLIKQFDQMKKMMKQLGQIQKGGRIPPGLGKLLGGGF